MTLVKPLKRLALAPLVPFMAAIVPDAAAAQSLAGRQAPGLPPETAQMLPEMVLGVCLLGLAAALVVLWRRQHDLRTRIARMRDAAPESARRSDQAAAQPAARKPGLMEELHRLEETFATMQSRLKTNQTTLDQACALAGLGTWTILPDLETIKASPHIGALLGLPEEDEVVRLDVLRQRIVPEDRDAFDAAIASAIAATDNRMTEAEFRAVGASGEVRIFRARTGLDDAVPGDPESVVSGIIQDITELRRNETALERSRQLDRLAGETARISGWSYDIADQTLSGNSVASSLLGIPDGGAVSAEDVIARFEGEHARDRIERSFWTCVGGGNRFDEVARFRTLDGDEAWLRVIGEAQRDPSGRIVSVCGAVQDVGELVGAKRATEHVRSLLQTFLDVLDYGFAIQDRDGTIQYMNRRAHGILGMPDMDLVGRNIWHDVPAVAGTDLERAVVDALESGESQNFEGEIGLAGQWIAVAVHPTAAGVAIYFNDVTEERDSRARLRLLDAAVAQVDDVVLITEASPLQMPGPRVIFVNDAFVRMTGFSRDEVLGNTPRILQGPGTERGLLDEISAALEASRPWRTELTNYCKDGTPFTTEVNITPLFNAEGDCTHFVSVQRDTTRRRADEERMRASEEQFRLASRASQDIIWDWNLLTGVIWNSASAEENGQGSIERVWDGHVDMALERIHPEDRLKIIESLNAALAGDSQSWRCDYRGQATDGSWRFISDKAFIVRDEAGVPRRMVGAMSDVTDLRLLDAQLHQAQKLEAVGHLTGGIAHDFNNLLTIILGNCDILLDDIGDETALRPLIQSIEDAAERGANVSNDLLAFSRRQQLEIRATDINALIRRASGLFERAIDASVTLRYELSDRPTVAHVDPDKLQAALLNLVINAVAAIPQDGTITLRSRSAAPADADASEYPCPQDFIQVDVSDDGVGMQPEVVARAFEPFFTTKEAGVGTGMGLSSVYGFVKQSGGHARIMSEPGKGTTVTLCLPVADKVEPETPEEAPKPSKSGDGDRILVVDDDAALRDMVQSVLTRMGYRTTVAENGESALALLEADSGFDLLLTDIVMPGGINGPQLAKSAQVLHPEIGILFMSGYARDALPKERHVPSDIPMLYKPFRKAELIEKVQSALANTAMPGD